jgi:hypothetical protein
MKSFGPADSLEVSTEGSAPIEFTFKGRRFRIHTVLASWRESGGWWNRISQTSDRALFDDQPKSLYTVEAAPIGTLATFQLERDETTGQWVVRSL